ncbi:hypothetical protein ABIC98_004091 [Arthrobacter nitrophenolicus]|uniref:Uncharacterized protein n=1 Tax=Arthrobacter nitrophenolicus TaxID=683150 RepID=A0ACC6TL64_9MICC
MRSTTRTRLHCHKPTTTNKTHISTNTMPPTFCPRPTPQRTTTRTAVTSARDPNPAAAPPSACMLNGRNSCDPATEGRVTGVPRVNLQCLKKDHAENTNHFRRHASSRPPAANGCGRGLLLRRKRDAAKLPGGVLDRFRGGENVQ